MRFFSGLYAKVRRWSGHPHAQWYLGGLSFAESSFFPVPPDVLLAPMTLAQPRRWAKLAALTTAASVLGGMAGYAIGYFALDFVEPLLQRFGYWDGYLQVRHWFERWGFWAVFAAGFSPIPYKLFTIAAGALVMALPPFALASLVGRGGRFFLVAGLVKWLGPAAEDHLRRHIDLIGWICVGLIVIAIVVLH